MSVPVRDGPAPAATALHLTRRPGRAILVAIALSVGIALVIVWMAIARSYQTNWPVGFFVGIGSAVAYAAGQTWTFARRHHGAPARAHVKS
jgi:zinc/manganese transport system permease protein